MQQLFTDHPASVGESYLGHLRFAFGFGGTMLLGGLACVLHGLFPFLFETSGSRRVRALHGVLMQHPARRAVPASVELYNWSI